MAMKERYYTVDGQMIGYKTAAGRKDFLTDALGSVTAEVDQTGATKTFDGRYKPYGGDLSSTGTRGSYGWVGTWGYRGTGLTNSSHYTRRRHVSKTSGMWSTKDPIWPSQSAYDYCQSRPTFYIDPTGLGGVMPRSIPPPLPITCGANSPWNNFVISLCFGCRPGDLYCQALCNYYADMYYKACPGPLKPPLKPGCFKWITMPGIGVVPIQIPCPPIPSRASGIPKKDCISQTDRCNGNNTPDCVDFHTEYSDGGFANWLESCKTCCAKEHPEGGTFHYCPEVRKCQDECYETLLRRAGGELGEEHVHERTSGGEPYPGTEPGRVVWVGFPTTTYR